MDEGILGSVVDDGMDTEDELFLLWGVKEKVDVGLLLVYQYEEEEQF